MKARNATQSLIVVLLVLTVALLKWRQEPTRKEAFNRNINELQYTKAVRCRMECRAISEEDIKEVVKKGIIHFNRSNRRGQPCPTFALQGRTKDQEYIRVHFAQCPDTTTVLDCYNLEQDTECNCPGAELKN